MPRHRYFMCDLNGAKIEKIMAFNVAERTARSRSLLEFGMFVAAVFGYLLAVAVSA